MTGYFVDSARTFIGCEITPLLDGAEYASALRESLDQVGRDDHPGQFVLLAGWWLGLTRGGFELVGSRSVRMVDAPPFCLDPWPDGRVPFEDPPDESTALLDLLADKRQAGVEIRALGWVSPLALRMPWLAKVLGGTHVVAINTLTMRSIAALRQRGALAATSTIGHLVGSTHTKMTLVCDGRNAVGFTGGMDLRFDRWSRADHAGQQVWHDVVARIQGPAVQSIYDHFRVLWEANRAVARRAFSLDGEQIVGVPVDIPALPARSVPNVAEGNHRVQELVTMPRRSGHLEADFTYHDALRQAIAAAVEYVYVEDPLLWSTEVMDWLNAALRREPDLRVTFVTGGLEDPSDPPLPHPQYLCQSINHHLLPGVDADRVRLYRRPGVVVHAKTVVVDDSWACIGSGNISRRSLCTDIEHGFAFMDADGDLVRRYRNRLWGHHDGALTRVPVPVPEIPMTRRVRNRYDAGDDPDSRRRWWPRLL